jgi:hypothetical protein
MRFAEWDAYCKDALVGGVSIESMRETPKWLDQQEAESSRFESFSQSLMKIYLRISNEADRFSNIKPPH